MVEIWRNLVSTRDDVVGFKSVIMTTTWDYLILVLVRSTLGCSMWLKALIFVF